MKTFTRHPIVLASLILAYPMATQAGTSYRVRSVTGAPVQAAGFKPGAMLVNCRDDSNQMVKNFKLEGNTLANQEADYEGKKQPNWCAVYMDSTLKQIEVKKGATLKLPDVGPAFISCFEPNGEFGTNFEVSKGMLKNSNDGDLTCAYQTKQPGDLEITLKNREKTIIKQLKGEAHPVISCFRQSDGEYATNLNYDLTTGEIISYDSEVNCLIRVSANQEVFKATTAPTTQQHKHP